jgi:hypothetical protein
MPTATEQKSWVGILEVSSSDLGLYTKYTNRGSSNATPAE